MVVEVGVLGECREFPFIFGLDVNCRFHVFAVTLIGLDTDGMELIFCSFDSLFEIATTLLAFRSVIAERSHDFSDTIVVLLEESERIPDGEMITKTVVRFLDYSSSNWLAFVSVGLQERRMCKT